MQQLGNGGGLARALALTFCHASCCRAARLETMVSCWVGLLEVLVEQDQDDQGRGHGDSRQYQDAILDRAKLHLVFLVRRKLYELSAWWDIPPAMLPSKAENEGGFAILSKNGATTESKTCLGPGYCMVSHP